MASSSGSMDRPHRMLPSVGQRVTRRCDMSRLTLVHMVKTFVPTWPQMPMSNGVGVWQEDDGRRVLEQAVKIAEDAVKT